MLMRFDPFRDTDRLLGRTGAFMPMDAFRGEEAVLVELDLPGVDPDTIDMTVERDVLTVTAQRPARELNDVQVLAAERPHGQFTRQLFLGKGLDPDRIEASYEAGVLQVKIPVAEEARPRRIPIEVGAGSQAISANAS